MPNKDFAIYLFIYMAAMLVFDLPWAWSMGVQLYFTILFEILTVENVGIDTKTKSLDS